MKKEEIGKYYYSIKSGRRSWFILVLCWTFGKSFETWRKTMREWRNGDVGKKELTTLVNQEFERLTKDDCWMDEYNRFLRSH